MPMKHGQLDLHVYIAAHLRNSQAKLLGHTGQKHLTWLVPVLGSSITNTIQIPKYKYFFSLYLKYKYKIQQIFILKYTWKYFFVIFSQLFLITICDPLTVVVKK